MASVIRRPGLCVLMYHRVSKADGIFRGVDVSVFRQEMMWLRANCRVMTPDEVEESLHCREGPRPRVLLTFDDGYLDYYENAYPILRDLGLPSLVFLTTSFMDRGGLMWHDVVRLAVRETKKREVEIPWEANTVLTLDGDHSRSALENVSVAHLKAVAQEERDFWLRQLLGALGVGQDELHSLVGRQMLNWDEVRATSDLTRYGGHTHTHPILSRSGMEVQAREIESCRDRILAETGVAPKHFAYPNGQRGDYTEQTKALVRASGFEAAYSTSRGLNGPETDRLELRRMSAPRSVGDVAWYLTRARWC